MVLYVCVLVVFTMHFLLVLELIHVFTYCQLICTVKCFCTYMIQIPFLHRNMSHKETRSGTHYNRIEQNIPLIVHKQGNFRCCSSKTDSEQCRLGFKMSSSFPCEWVHARISSLHLLISVNPLCYAGFSFELSGQLSLNC